MQKAPDADPLWQRGIEAISESQDLVEARRAYLDQANELALQRWSSANASLAFARRAAHAFLHPGRLTVAEDKS